jgi:alkanesulfonate monooxygenase SsuD/methylene tetrahydromethanopterin reductase-like flavin-dependent oxidoreductase (luciferase family)
MHWETAGMDIGVFFFPTHYSIDISELAVELEQRGFESLLACEHTHIPASRKSPFPGGGDLPKEYFHTYDPFNAAKSVASLDRLSGGRFIFGIGGGWNVDEMENHGVKYNTRFKQLREHVLAMKQLWTEEKGEFHGDFVDFDPAYSSPKPVQTPHPPILLGGETDYTLRRIVEFCDGWIPRGPLDMVDGMARLKRVADEAGRDMASLSVTVFRPEAEKAALEKYAEAGVNRVLLQMPSADRDTCLKTLDSYMPLVK